MAYTLYGSFGTATFGPHAVLEEAGLTYHLEYVDPDAGDTKSLHFMAINPAGYVPALECDDGTVLFEAAAIMLYLADSHGLSDLAPPPEDPSRGLFYRSLFFLTSTVQEAYKHFYYADRFTTDPADGDRIRDRSLELMAERWAVADLLLENSGPYFLGERYSLADIYLVMLVSWHANRSEFLADNPAVKRNFDLVITRPSLQSVLQAHNYV